MGTEVSVTCSEPPKEAQGVFRDLQSLCSHTPQRTRVACAEGAAGPRPQRAAAQMGISHWALWALAGLGTGTKKLPGPKQFRVLGEGGGREGGSMRAREAGREGGREAGREGEGGREGGLMVGKEFVREGVVEKEGGREERQKCAWVWRDRNVHGFDKCAICAASAW